MRILITGGHGFIGGRLGRYLHQAGHQVILGSRNAVSPPNWLPESKTACIKWNDEAALERTCTGIDIVIHAAGMNAQDSASNPLAALEFNGLATARLFEAASRTGVKRFIYFSTAHVYASPLVGVITEDTCPRNLHPYATSHLAGENAVLSANQRGQTEGVVLRLSNAFGAPAEKEANCWKLLVNELCMQAVQGRQLVLRSSGSQQRDFISLAEVTRVVEHLTACNLDAQTPMVFNVGSGVSQTVYEMARMVQQRCKQVLGFEPELKRPETRDDERHERLEYRPERLTKIDMEISQDYSAEMDDLLVFCQLSFNENKNKPI